MLNNEMVYKILTEPDLAMTGGGSPRPLKLPFIGDRTESPS